MLTVPDRIRHLGFEATSSKRERWMIGLRVANEFERRYGFRPPKDLRNKSRGAEGSHCFAMYAKRDLEWVDAMILRFFEGRERQQTFWDGV